MKKLLPIVALLLGMVFTYSVFADGGPIIIGEEPLSSCELDPINPVHSIEITDTFIEICKASNDCQRIEYRALPGQVTNAEAALKEGFQSYLDTSQKISQLPDDDPDKTIDPAIPGLFWDQNDLVSRSIIVTDVSWLGDRFNLRLSRVLEP